MTDKLKRLATVLLNAAIEEAAKLEPENDGGFVFRPISTAPKDGRVIIGWFGEDRYNPYAETVHWIQGGWHWTHDGDMPMSEPTHWIPLPSIPTIETETP